MSKYYHLQSFCKPWLKKCLMLGFVWFVKKKRGVRRKTAPRIKYVILQTIFISFRVNPIVSLTSH